MIFSKSSGYAIRAILYLALINNEKSKVRVDDISRELMVPKHFLSKVLKKLVKKGVLDSTKGPYGGFSLNKETLSITLFDLVALTNGELQFDNCVLRLKKCNPSHPCPLHEKMVSFKQDLQRTLMNTSIGDLLNPEQPEFIKSIATI
ncbi:Rrf2 family transcriptional regulator [Pollutibacter soli]|uniref:RrF2 family transcriptional regulator n=1 Tax=Pollutibacter soli TaxID=3034157 RepID=UPI0030139684